MPLLDAQGSLIRHRLNKFQRRNRSHENKEKGIKQ